MFTVTDLHVATNINLVFKVSLWLICHLPIGVILLVQKTKTARTKKLKEKKLKAALLLLRVSTIRL